MVKLISSLYIKILKNAQMLIIKAWLGMMSNDKNFWSTVQLKQISKF